MVPVFLSRSLSVMISILIVLVTACAPPSEETSNAPVAEAPIDPERDAREAARAEELEKSLVELAALDVEELRSTTRRRKEELEKANVPEDVKRDFRIIGEGDAQLAEIQRHSSERNAAAIVAPALAAMVALDPVLTSRRDKADAAESRLVKLLLDDGSQSEMEKARREMNLSSAVFSAAATTFRVFSVSLTTVAKNGPPATRRAAFEAIESALSQVSAGRAHLEAAMRLAWEQEEDAATQARFEGVLARHEIPLEAPKSEEQPAAAEASLAPTP